MKKDTWKRFSKLLKKGGDYEWHMIDASVIKAHQHSLGSPKKRGKQSIGKSVTGNSTKIHVKVDSLGLPLELSISEGQVHDINHAEQLVNSKCDFLIADRGYDSNKFRSFLKKLDIKSVIPGKRNRKEKIPYDKEIYKERNAVERFLCKIKNFRKAATRYDKLDFMYLGGLFMISTIIWLIV